MSPPREANIALWARLYRVLADRDEYMMARDLAERIDRTDPERATCLSEVDAELVAYSTEIDRVCGAAARLLRKGWSAGVVEILGWLDPDRLAAVALALPENRRRAVLGKDYDWALAFGAIDMDRVREVEDIAERLNALARDMDHGIRSALGPEIAEDVARFGREQRRFYAGLPADLTVEDLLVMLRGVAGAEAERVAREHLAPVE